ncbi:hypothetical protein TBR22_A01820 [Luteitalea sp. TBR-22]|nr:hypothetical protein TBR22_A01820 [Luteitalea sp. TBR-22]
MEAAVRQAATFVEANAEQPMSVDDIASACGLHVRTLYRNFNSEFRLSPKRYLRRCRLDRIRADLLVARPGLTVTTVAIRHGVTHLGRFAREYAAAFGEPPSATLRRAREAIGAPGAALAPTLPSGQ